MRSHLDDQLHRSVPELSEPDDLDEALEELVASTRRAAVPRRRRPRRAVLIWTTTAMLLAGGTAAAATGIGGWNAPWADKPLGSLSFRVPSGGVCEQRIGDLHIGNAKAQAMVQKWLSGHTLKEVADVGASLDAIRADHDQTWEHGPGGHRIKFGYGTKYYDADYEYVDAVFRAEQAAIAGKLTAEGFTSYVPVDWASELQCSGPNPNPSVPAWAK
jgi:hypothetical protein